MRTAFAALLLLFLVAACDSNDIGEAVPIEETEFDASLDIDLSTMTKAEEGYYYQDIQQGTGASIGEDDYVSIRYEAWLADGTLVDRNLPGGEQEAFSFTVQWGQVIDGLDLGIEGMKAGGSRLLVLPSELAYGERGLGAIPPHSVMVFWVDVEAVAPRIVDTAFAGKLGVDLAAMTKHETGYYYQDLEVGTGEELELGDAVSVFYEGWLPDGTLFDERRGDGVTPFSYVLGGRQVISGWDVGLVGARRGGTRLLVLPANLAYGAGERVDDNGDTIIPAYSILVFRIEIQD